MGVMIIDSVMGSGKTTNMIRFMKENEDKRFLYISPFKTEVGDGNTGDLGRIQKELPDMFPRLSMPRNTGDGKLTSLHKLLERGFNVATTHSMFCRFTDETNQLVLDGGYIVIIDEAVDCVQIKDNLTEKEVRALVDSEWIRVASDGLVTWNEDKNPEFDGRYRDIRELANTGGLRLFDSKVLVVEYPPRLLKEIPECYVMTYLFGGSLMHCWMKANNIPFEYVDPEVFELQNPSEIKKNIRNQLVVLGSRKLDNKYTDQNHVKYRYSSKWYKENSTVAERLEVKMALESCVSNHKTPEGMVFWTTFKDSRERLEGKGYKKGWIDPSTGIELESFLPYNIKAINDYRNHDLVMHTVNLFRNPTEVRYFKWRGVEFNEDLWALGELLQFIWRARIRQGQPTKVLVISKRMRRLLTDWLKEDR